MLLATVVHQTVVAAPSALIVSFTTAAGAGPQAILLALPAPAIATLADGNALHALLAATAPRLTARFDADPCFPHPAAPPPPDVPALSALPGTPVPVAFASFPGPGPNLEAWLRAHRVSAAMPTGPVLALAIPAGASVAPVRLDFAKPVAAVPLVASVPATVLLVGGGPQTLQGLAAAPLPGGAGLPEFVYGQFDRVFQAMLAVASTPAVLDYAAALPSGFATRFELRSPGGGPVAIVPAPNQRTLRTAFATRIGWKGEYTLACTQGFTYRRALTSRWQAENATLAALTGWRSDDIRQAMVAGWTQSVRAQGH